MGDDLEAMTAFTRREVNRALLATALAMAGSARLPARTHLYDFAIAGGFHHGLDQVRDLLQPGERLDLRLEPDNPHDPSAVAVMRGALRLGYLPREANAPVARLIATGGTVLAEVVGPLHVERVADIPDDLVFTGFTDGDPRVRLTVVGDRPDGLPEGRPSSRPGRAEGRGGRRDPPLPAPLAIEATAPGPADPNTTWSVTERQRCDASLRTHPRDGAAGPLAISLVPYPEGEFHLRIETMRLCAWLDNDSTTAPGALHHLREAPDRLDRGEIVVIWFDDESLDTARLTMIPGLDGWTRLRLDDWCEPDLGPRLDIRVPTRVLGAELRRAVARF